MNPLERGAVTFMGCLLFFYVSVSFIGWDLSWVAEINSLPEIVRFLLLAMLIIAFCISAVVYNLTEED